MNFSITPGSRRALLALVAVLALIVPGLCNTWIVDQANGPGTNFLDIPPAIAVAAPGDVILVRQGNYSTFVLARGITIMGQGAVTISGGGAAINAVPAGEIAALCNLRNFNGFFVDACSGTVLLQRVDGRMHVQSRVDVRIRSASAGYGSEALKVVDSRVQFTQSTASGADGGDAGCFPPSAATPGKDGMVCQGVSRVHAALSSARGGEGGWGQFNIGCNFSGASGGNGITTSGPAGGMLELILNGDQVFAGYGGDPGGGIGKSMLVGGNVTAWSAQTSFSPTPPAVAGGGLLWQLQTVEPTLELIGSPAPGATITLRLRAQPGSFARLNVGNTPLLQSVPGVLVENLLLKARSFDRGIVPASGMIDTPWSFPASAPLGKLLIFQARIANTATGTVRRSNSLETIVQ